mmetsp:Transcript_29197/g.41324  ORF Transcript_29197/g.41324 Transcript_29197/m.41324 type:complete len:239 (+) Transcript_29197:1841-2557(+)
MPTPASQQKQYRTPSTDPRSLNRKSKINRNGVRRSLSNKEHNHGGDNAVIKIQIDPASVVGDNGIVEPRRPKKTASKSVKRGSFGSGNFQPAESSFAAKKIKAENKPATKKAETSQKKNPTISKSAPKSKTKPNAKHTLKKKPAESVLTKQTNPRLRAAEIWVGAPDEPLEGGWPAGWTKRIFQRASGATKGSTDRYWYTPVLKKKLRSMAEVKRFIAAFKTCHDEQNAWDAFKAKKG